MRLLEQIIPYLVMKKDKAETIVNELRTYPFCRWAATIPEARARASETARESWKHPEIRPRRMYELRRHPAWKGGI